MNRICSSALAAVAVGFAPAAVAQQPAASAPPALAVANPSYTTMVLEVPVARPAAEVWAKVGKYCAIKDYYPGVTCVITAGKEGELGAVRLVAGVVSEIMVAKTDLSYTYDQPVRVGVPYDQYHSTLEARPVTAATSKLVYTYMWDDSVMGDAAARAAARAGRASRLMAALEKAKAAAEAN